MKIIVTGALGHIGSRLIRELGVEFPGAEIVMIDNMLTQRFSSLFNLPAIAQYRFVEADVTVIDLKPIFKGATVVIHLAAITDAATSFDKASELEANNYIATKQVAEASLIVGARLISLSSTSVYGTQNSVVSEECGDDELAPQSPYAETKLKEELLVSRLFKEDGLQAITCRFGTIYGISPGMRFHTAVNKFCWQAIMGQPITIWRTAYDQKRPYLDLSDATHAIAFIIRNQVFDGKIYNILSGNITVREVVNTVKEFVPSLTVSFVDSKIMNQLSYEVSCERFQKLGFKFSGNLRRGIAETIEVLKNSNFMS
jgi:nucleoside-diphosphate-sugar epimerase